MKLSQEQIDQIHKISGWCVVGMFVLLLVVLILNCVPFVKWLLVGLLVAAIVVNEVFRHWATNEEKEERKAEMKEVLQEIESEKKKRTKIVFNGKSPLIDLSPKQIAVVHDFLCKTHDQGGHIKTSELKHILHALEDRGDIDLSHREQVIAWVEDITKRSVDTSKFWNEYDWRRSTDQEKKWGKRIIEAYDKLR